MISRTDSIRLRLTNEGDVEISLLQLGKDRKSSRDSAERHRLNFARRPRVSERRHSAAPLSP